MAHQQWPMPYSEDDLLPISALQHLAYCERQCALIHLEAAWAENVHTTEGRHLHERTHEGETRMEGEILVARGLRVRSLQLGLTGQADVVEFHPDPEAGITLPRRKGRWRPFPVEYKRGRPKRGRMDEVQLCAQALCLEEMLGISVPEAALFYGRTRRRQAVLLDTSLREQTRGLARRLHELAASRRTPPAVYEKKKCEQCSLLEICLPRRTGSPAETEERFRRELKASLAMSGEGGPSE